MSRTRRIAGYQAANTLFNGGLLVSLERVEGLDSAGDIIVGQTKHPSPRTVISVGAYDQAAPHTSTKMNEAMKANGCPLA